MSYRSSILLDKAQAGFALMGPEIGSGSGQPVFRSIVASDIQAALGDLGSALPVYSAADAGKLLSVDENGSLSWNFPEISLTGDASGSGTIASAIELTLADSGVVAGSYLGITFDAKGRATSADVSLPSGIQFGSVDNLPVGSIAVATLDPLTGKIPSIQLPSSILGTMQYQGTFNISSNVSLPAAPVKGQYYVCVGVGSNTDGSADIGGLNLKAMDWIAYNGASWDKIDNTEQVVSVNGKVGAVVLGVSDISGAASQADLATLHSTISGEFAAADATLKSVIEGEFAAADSTLQAALEAELATLHSTISGEFAAADSTLQSVLEGEFADANATLKSVIEGEFEAADATLKSVLEGEFEAADATLKSVLEGEFAAADATLKSVIEGEFAAADSTLQAALEAELATLHSTIDGEFEAADATLKSVLEGEFEAADATLKSVLEGEFADADSTLQAALEAELATLHSSISDEFAAADATLKSVLEGEFAAADATLKSVLEGEFAAADSTLQAALEAELATLHSTISGEFEAADATLKSVLEGEFAAADSTLQAALEAELATLHSTISGEFAAADATLKSIIEGEFAAADATLKSVLEGEFAAADATLKASLEAELNVAALVSKSANYQLSASDSTVLVSTGSIANVTITLPAAPRLGQIVNIKKVDAGSKAVIIVGDSGALIDGESEQDISYQWGCITMTWDGSAWFIL